MGGIYPAAQAANRLAERTSSATMSPTGRRRSEMAPKLPQPRNPLHRVKLSPASRRVRVRAHGEELADSTNAIVLSETGLPDRFYLPLADVHEERLTPSEAHTHCPYKGDASYWSVEVGGRTIPDAVFAYRDPLEEVRSIAGHVSFLHDDVEVLVDSD